MLATIVIKYNNFLKKRKATIIMAVDMLIIPFITIFFFNKNVLININPQVIKFSIIVIFFSNKGFYSSLTQLFIITHIIKLTSLVFN